MDGRILFNPPFRGSAARNVRKVKRGQPVTIPSFGYDIVDKQYVINEEKAAIVRKIFTDYIDGKNSMQIASELNEIGVKTTRGNPFENRTIDYILKIPFI